MFSNVLEFYCWTAFSVEQNLMIFSELLILKLVYNIKYNIFPEQFYELVTVRKNKCLFNWKKM